MRMSTYVFFVLVYKLCACLWTPVHHKHDADWTDLRETRDEITERQVLVVLGGRRRVWCDDLGAGK